MQRKKKEKKVIVCFFVHCNFTPDGGSGMIYLGLFIYFFPSTKTCPFNRDVLTFYIFIKIQDLSKKYHFAETVDKRLAVGRGNENHIEKSYIYWTGLDGCLLGPKNVCGLCRNT